MEELDEIEKKWEQTMHTSPYVFEDADWQKAKKLLDNKRKKRPFLMPFFVFMCTTLTVAFIADKSINSISKNTTQNKTNYDVNAIESSTKNQTSDLMNQNTNIAANTKTSSILLDIKQQESAEPKKITDKNYKQLNLTTIISSSKNKIKNNTIKRLTQNQTIIVDNKPNASINENEYSNTYSENNNPTISPNYSEAFEALFDKYSNQNYSVKDELIVAEKEKNETKNITENRIATIEKTTELIATKKDTTKNKNWKVRILINVNPGVAVYSHFNNNKPYAQFAYQVFTTVDIHLKKNFSLRTGLQIIHAFDASKNNAKEEIHKTSYSSSDIAFLSSPILLNSDVSNIIVHQKIKIINKIQIAIPIAVQYTLLQKNIFGIGMQATILVGGKTNITQKVTGTINNPPVITSLDSNAITNIPLLDDKKYNTVYIKGNQFETNEFNQRISNKSIFPIAQLGCIFYYDRIIKDKLYVGFNSYVGITKAVKPNEVIQTKNVYEYFIGLSIKYKIK